MLPITGSNVTTLNGLLTGVTQPHKENLIKINQKYQIFE